jgi:hypothetical protein
MFGQVRIIPNEMLDILKESGWVPTTCRMFVEEGCDTWEKSYYNCETGEHIICKYPHGGWPEKATITFWKKL